MKKLLLIIIVLAVSTQIHAKIKTKHIVGTWSYVATTPDADLTGELKFTKDGKKLTGEVIADDGSTFPMSKIEIKDGDVLYFEIQPDYEVMKVSLNIDGLKFEGKGSTSEWELPITGEKKE
jgi:hypothetical protein